MTELAASRWSIGTVFALLLTLTFLVYFPALTGELLWDDAGHVTDPALQPWSGLLRIWFEPGVTQQYYPLLHSAFWLEHRLWGEATLGYHLVNVLWHATSACLLVAILRRLAVPGALFAGLLFALHPVCVESVAWISEQKNTLSGVFYLAAALAWLRFEEERRPGRYAIATLWFVAALLTKTVTATLPAALLVVAWWRRGRLSWRSDVLPLLPWLVAGIALGLFTAWFERVGIGATGAAFHLSVLARALLAGHVVWFYLGKLIWPAGLAFFYPHWTIDPTAPGQWGYGVAALGLLAALGWWQRRNRSPLAAALLFAGTLFPVLGFVNVYPFVFSYVADHFQYFAAMAVIAFAAAAATRFLDRLATPTWTRSLLASAVLLPLAGLTWSQSSTYQNLLTLYQTTVARTPSSWVAHLNLGTVLADAGELESALSHLQRSLALKPDVPETLNSLGDALNRLGRPAEARPLLERALKLQPRFLDAQNTLGVTLMALRQYDDGIAAFRRALELNPTLTRSHVNLGWALANAGRFTEALPQFEGAQRLEPQSANVEFKWGLVLAMQRRVSDALPHLQRASELQPDDADIRFALANAYWDLGRRAEATAQFEQVLRLAPNHAAAREALERMRRGM